MAAAAFAIVPRHVLGGNGFLAPSDEITKGIIGTGVMGRGHLKYEGRTIAICDVDSNHLNQTRRMAGDGVRTYSDFREFLQNKDIDVVHIATPPHWHGIMAVEAAKAGKDIWCEKPMTRTIGEGLAVIDAVQRHDRMFRLNTWFRFRSNFYGMGVPVKPIKKLVEARALGWPLKATISGTTGFNWKFYWSGKTNLEPQEVPEELDYNMWLGPAPFKPYNEERVHANFRGYWDYDGGGLGDMGQHYMDPVQYLLEKDDTSPISVEVDAPQQHPEAVGTWRRITYTYDDGCQIILDGENSDKNAKFLEGPDGWLNKGMTSSLPDVHGLIDSLPDPAPQILSFNESVRTRQKFPLHEMNGHRSCNLVNMGKVALRLGRNLKFDPVKQEFIDDPGANALIHQPMRGHWKI